MVKNQLCFRSPCRIDSVFPTFILLFRPVHTSVYSDPFFLTPLELASHDVARCCPFPTRDVVWPRHLHPASHRRDTGPPGRPVLARHGKKTYPQRPTSLVNQRALALYRRAHLTSFSSQCSRPLRRSTLPRYIWLQFGQQELRSMFAFFVYIVSSLNLYHASETWIQCNTSSLFCTLAGFCYVVFLAPINSGPASTTGAETPVKTEYGHLLKYSGDRSTRLLVQQAYNPLSGPNSQRAGLQPRP